MKTLTNAVYFNVYNNKHVIREIVKFWKSVGGTVCSDVDGAAIGDNTIEVIDITTGHQLSWWSEMWNRSGNGKIEKNIHTFNDFVVWYNLNLKEIHLNVGDKVKISCGRFDGTGVILRDVSDICPDTNFAKKSNYLVKLPEMVTVEKPAVFGTRYLVFNEIFLTKIEPEPMYIDEVHFYYDDGVLRTLNVLNEDDKYIEGHKLGTKDFRRYLKSKIQNGKIFRFRG